MSLFGPRFYTTPEPNFSGLFRLIDDFDKYASQSGNGSVRRNPRHVQTFAPKFDLKETEGAFELHGELPGIEKDNVHIEFTDPQTIVLHGKVERSSTAGTPPAGLVGGTEMSGAITEGTAGDEPVVVEHESETSSVKSHQATVEDDIEDGKTTGAQPTPATTVAETAKPAEQTQPATPKAKYWISERSIGEFSRSFSFPSRVDPENVKASLKNGILTVTVPKAKKHESRRVLIN